MDILDITKLDEVSSVGFFDAPDAIASVAVVGRYAYLAAFDALRIVDVSDPANPIEIGALPVEGEAVGPASTYPCFSLVVDKLDFIHHEGPDGY